MFSAPETIMSLIRFLYVNKPLFINIASVAGVHPAAFQRAVSRFGQSPVAHHGLRATHQNLANLATRQLIVIFVSDFYLGPHLRSAGGKQQSRFA